LASADIPPIFALEDRTTRNNKYFRKALMKKALGTLRKIIIYLFICPLTFPQARSKHNRNSE